MATELYQEEMAMCHDKSKSLRWNELQSKADDDALSHKLCERQVASGRFIPAEADPEDLLFEGDLNEEIPPEKDLFTVFAAQK